MHNSIAAKPAMTPQYHAEALLRRFADWKR